MSATVDGGGGFAWRWVAVAVLIAIAAVGFGTWWVYGLDRGGAMGGMAGMATTDARLPPVPAYYDGDQILFVHPAASDSEMAGTLTEMMGGSPVLVDPSLADVPDDTTADVYVFANGIDGPGPLGHQLDVFPSAPGDSGYRSLREVVLVTWHDPAGARELTSAEEVEAAEADGAVAFDRSGVVVNAPFLTWPGGER